MADVAEHAVERYDPYGLPEYAGIRVDGAYVFNDAIADEDLRLQISRAQAVLDFRAAERPAPMTDGEQTMSPLAEALHDAFYAQEGKGLMGAALWEAMAEDLYKADVGFMSGV